MTSYKIVKTISNNIVLALDINEHEVFLRGKGIGFGRRKGDRVSSESVEKLFTLVDENEQQLYHQLLKTTSPRLIEIASDMIQYIQSQVDKPLNEHIHVALTDHIAFLVRRCRMGVPIENPFLLETQVLYPKEYAIAEEVMHRLEQELNLRIPASEAGFIALHVITALSIQTLESIQKQAYLIAKMVRIMENHFEQKLDKNNLNYVRLITHFRFVIERVERGEQLDAPQDIMDSIRKAYPECYALSWKIVKSLQQDLRKPISEAEVFYLSLHLYRFACTS